VTGLVILLGFSFLEFLLATQVDGALKKMVLIALVTLELGVFYQWNKIFG
jgi:hypothetical protein